MNQQNTRRQESAFKRNPWSFAKSVCSNSSKVLPTFSKLEAFQHFSQSFSNTNSKYIDLPPWIHSVMPSSEITDDFDLSPITPANIKGILKRYKKRSAPGEDGITYYHLKNLPTSHHFLATLYSKILLESNVAPPSWGKGKIILLHKHGDTSCPSNFRPIALSSTIGKLFHKILALRLEEFCLSNEIIDPAIQKGFLSGINGTMEHIFALTALIDHARSNGMPLTITFVDLKDAFGSICHNLINDIMSHLKLPPEITCYITDLYSKVKASIQTKNWSTPVFPISRGVFQGDTMSPIIFLIAFNPVLKLAQSLDCPGFAFRIPITDSEDFPDCDSNILVLWDEPESDEPSGWYRCNVLQYLPNGSVQLRYPDGATESVHLSKVTWKFARKSAKVFYSLNDSPPSFTPASHRRSRQKKFAKSTEHKVKGFADDLTIISANKNKHSSELMRLDECASELDLEIRADKCYSFSIVGYKKDKTYCVPLRSGTTKPISAVGTKFLGRYIADTNKSTFTSASSSLLSKFNAFLQALDSRPIRGEYKLWIYQNYLAPSFHYHLAVNPSTSKVIKNLEASSTRLIKKWLNLPKSATQAILYHPDVLNIPQVNTIRLKAKISYLSAILNSPDLLIRELRVLLNNPKVQSNLDVSNICWKFVDSAPDKIASFPLVKKKCVTAVNNYVKQQWDKHLSSLEVQGKFSEIALLESENKTWKKIMLHGLPYGQLSFILKAGSDTLPHHLTCGDGRFNVTQNVRYVTH